MAVIATPTLSAASAISTSMASSAAEITAFGVTFNSMAIVIGLITLGILVLFYRIQSSRKLDFTDMITKDGRSVSLTKVLQLVGGITATWIMVKLTLTGGLTEALFGLYLTYVGAIEGYSKFVAAKYNYNEKSVKDTTASKTE